MTLPKLSTIKTKVIAQNDRLKVALAAQALQSPLVQLPFRQKSLYIGDPTLVKQVWNNDTLPSPAPNDLDSLFPYNITSEPNQIKPWLGLAGHLVQNPSLEILVQKLNTAVDEAIKAWQQRKMPFLKPTLDATLLAHEIVFDTLFQAFFEEQGTAFETTFKKCISRLIAYTTKAVFVSPHWPSLYRIQYLSAYKAFNLAIKQKMKTPTGYFSQAVQLNHEKKILSETNFFNFILQSFLSIHQCLTNLLSAALYELAKNRGFFLLLQKETQTLLNNEKANNNDYGKLLVATSIAEETLRLFPPVTWFSLKLNKSITLDNTEIAAGTRLYTSPYAIQRDMRFWPAGNIFQITQSIEDPARQEHAFMPFGFLPGNAAMEVLASTFLTFAVTRLAQITHLSLPLINKAPNQVPYFGIRLTGDTALRITAAMTPQPQ